MKYLELSIIFIPLCF